MHEPHTPLFGVPSCALSCLPRDTVSHPLMRTLVHASVFSPPCTSLHAVAGTSTVDSFSASHAAMRASRGRVPSLTAAETERGDADMSLTAAETERGDADMNGMLNATREDDEDSGACLMLGEEGELGYVCTEAECIEGEVFLCTEPPDDPGICCELQEGMTMRGKPVYACTRVAP